MKKTAVAVAVAASALGMSQFAAADFVKDSKLSLDLRNYYYAQDTDGGLEGGQWGQAFMLNYKSGYTDGAVGFGVDLFGAAAYRLADHGDNIANNMLFNGANTDRLNKGGATVKAQAGKTNAYLGALRPNTPVFVANDARMLPQMVEGVLVTNQDIDGLTLAAGHVTKVSQRDQNQWADLAKEFSMLGADYKVMEGLTAQYYYGQVSDVYQQHFAGLKYSAAVGAGKLGADVRYFNTKDVQDGSATKDDANNLFSALVNYSVAGHTLGLGYQKNSDEYMFRAIGPSKYIISERMIGPGAMDNPDEAVTLVSYGFDFGTVGVKGLNASVIHQMGDGGLAKVDRTETDVVVGYTLQEGQFKGLSARLLHGMYRPDAGADIDQTRFIVNYSIPLM
jgi:hypothetical protein